MLARSYEQFIELFKDIEDPRQDEKITYPLHEVIFMVIVGVLGCQETWQDIIDFCNHRLHILRKYFAYEYGLPSISTLLRVMAFIDKKCIEVWLIKQAREIVTSLSNEHVIIDGKALKGKRKFFTTNQNTHTLNVFASKMGIVLTQKSIPEKSNEITAIKDVLSDANLAGAVVSIDAIGRQKDIAKQIIEKGGNYFLALKANHKSLYSDVQSMFNAKNTYYPDKYETIDKGHGRIENRTSESLDNIIWLKERHPHWEQLKSISKITRTRIIGNEETTAEYYYLSSMQADAKLDLEKSRNHWAIENNLHWVLDVQFGEDNSLIRKNCAAENMAAIRRIVLNIMQNYKNKNKLKFSLFSLRKHFMWSEEKMVDIIDSWIYNCS